MLTKNKKKTLILSVVILTTFLSVSYYTDGELTWLMHQKTNSFFVDYPSLYRTLDVQFSYIKVDRIIIPEGEKATVEFEINNNSGFTKPVIVKAEVLFDGYDRSPNTTMMTLHEEFIGESLDLETIVVMNPHQALVKKFDIIGECNGCRNSNGIKLSLIDQSSGKLLQEQYIKISIYNPYFKIWKNSFFQDAFAESLYTKRKVVEMKGNFVGENTGIALITNGTYTLGHHNLSLVGSGMLNVQEQQSNGPCKKVQGENYLLDKSGKNGFKIKLEGKLCHMGHGIKQLNAWFDITEAYGNVKNSMQKQRGTINAFIDSEEKVYDGFLRTKLIFISI